MQKFFFRVFFSQKMGNFLNFSKNLKFFEFSKLFWPQLVLKVFKVTKKIVFVKKR